MVISYSTPEKAIKDGEKHIESAISELRENLRFELEQIKNIDWGNPSEKADTPEENKRR